MNHLQKKGKKVKKSLKYFKNIPFLRLSLNNKVVCVVRVNNFAEADIVQENHVSKIIEIPKFYIFFQFFKFQGIVYDFINLTEIAPEILLFIKFYMAKYFVEKSTAWGFRGIKK